MRSKSANQKYLVLCNEFNAKKSLLLLQQLQKEGPDELFNETVETLYEVFTKKTSLDAIVLITSIVMYEGIISVMPL